MRQGDVGYAGIDPERVRLLARQLDESAAELRLRAARIESALAGVACSSVPGELRVIASGTDRWSADLRRRAADAERPIACIAEPVAPPKKKSRWSLGAILHTSLDVVGLVPVLGEPADAVNAAWYAAEGDLLNAGLSAAALFPLGGQAATGGKLAKKFSDELLESTEHAVKTFAATPRPLGPLSLKIWREAGGHLDIHIAQSVGELQTRLAKDRKLKAASSFFTEADALRAVDAALRANPDLVRDVVQKRLGKAELDVEMRGVGLVVTREMVRDGSRVRIVIKPFESGFYVLTGMVL